ncbi:c-type cytochrome biogenesis protein CcmI [Aliishimia ponticola]|uniref:C-type cytochrome biogenesis protein CcmI n=1 Tax=Aliishimia ponticola TaxID=2499833 RepID=A0A4S4NF87_9RHOB|nr:c-type cytochrome biogenesis protein CcmI [Aliishimia ponticola]THH38236.1 c-type cytochrome biogenesis protein CcmI [Aliishimia ponticola]
MSFWVIILGMAVLSAAILILASRRRTDQAAPAAAYDMQVYRDQLASLDRDVERGVVEAEDAERTRAEIGRRILAADRAAQQASGSAGDGSGWVWGALMGVGVLAGSIALYSQLGAPGYGDLALKDRIEAAESLRKTRPSQEIAEAEIDPAMLPIPVEPPSADYLALVEQLRSVVGERPDDPRGFQLLAQSERNLGNYSAAHRALARYLDLRGDAVTASEFADLADTLVLAAGGYVSPEAEIALARALQLDPANGPARYYWGLMMSQTGRPDQAFTIWDRQLRAGPPDAPWIGPIQAQIAEIAMRAGQTNYEIPQIGSAATPPRGPSQEDIDAAGDMSPQERMEMIEGMVSNLSERLASEGGAPQDWARLITALGVLGRSGDARAIFDEASRVFAADPGALDQINRAGERAGVSN